MAAQCRSGVCPGYGAAQFHGNQDVFTATATAALEMGAMSYAQVRCASSVDWCFDVVLNFFEGQHQFFSQKTPPSHVWIRCRG
eukprot:m.76155 g.76155  ORF g.76155 m.76155 type:complete len:83 (+) comp10502_c1_seq1:64-312(+)